MTVVSGSIVIRRPVDDVFDFVADERNEPAFNSEMRSVTKLTDGPIGKGTRFRAETVMRGRPVEMLVEFTDFQRPTRLGSNTHMAAMDLDGVLTFEPIHEGTRMRWEWNLHPAGVLRFLGPLVRVMGQRSEQRIWRSLKQHLEQQRP